jgi:omega-hydroxy-beta-dihydromenaquinone-9 sulfotransferase
MARRTGTTTPVQALAKQRYNAVAPRFWHGLTLGRWLKLIGRNRFSVSPTRIPTAVAITGFSTINSILGLFQSAIYSRRIEETRIESAPLFIIGHWRSGTTLLHELLIRDKRHTFPTTCQCFAPDHFLLTEGLLTRWLNFVMPDKRPMDNMEAGWSRPQEDEFALVNLGVPSPYLSMAFPNHGEVYPEYLTLRDLSAGERDAWKAALVAFLKRLTFRTPKRIVLKSPPHTARIRTLLEMFPEARFIHIVRDPVTVFLSTVRTWQALNYVQGLHVPRNEDWLHEYVLGSFERMYASFEEDRALLGPERLFELRYEDLVEDPKARLRDAYEQLDLGDFATAEPAIDAYLEQTRDYRASQYDIAPDLRAQIATRWGAYVRRYGYLTDHRPVSQLAL